MTTDRNGLWVFAYGSLMWRPGFPHLEAVHARLIGWRRCFCIYSTHHRGTPARPGLVLGLDRGGSCEGMAFRVAAENTGDIMRYLRRREQVNGVYRSAHVPVVLEAGPAGSRARAEVAALAFIVERAHPSYAGVLPLSEQAHLIRGARGLSGNNLDYLVSTVRHLRELGIRERELERLVGVAAPHALQRPHAAASTATSRALIAALRSTSICAPRMRPDQRRRFLHRMQGGSAPRISGPKG